MKYTHETWSVDLPENWLVEEADSCLAIYSTDGVGAFQVSSFFKENRDVTMKDLLEFSEVENPEKISLPFLKGIFHKTLDDGDSIFNWWLADADQLIFATYICSAEDEDVESTERERIINSLKPV